jgi:hypothetical protein
MNYALSIDYTMSSCDCDMFDPVPDHEDVEPVCECGHVMDEHDESCRCLATWHDDE